MKDLLLFLRKFKFSVVADFQSLLESVRLYGRAIGFSYPVLVVDDFHKVIFLKGDLGILCFRSNHTHG